MNRLERLTKTTPSSSNNNEPTTKSNDKLRHQRITTMNRPQIRTIIYDVDDQRGFQTAVSAHKPQHQQLPTFTTAMSIKPMIKRDAIANKESWQKDANSFTQFFGTLTLTAQHPDQNEKSADKLQYHQSTTAITSTNGS